MLKVARIPERASYRPTEIAKLLMVNRATIYRMMGDGSLGFIKVRKDKRVDWLSLVHHISQDSHDE